MRSPAVIVPFSSILLPTRRLRPVAIAPAELVSVHRPSSAIVSRAGASTGPAADAISRPRKVPTQVPASDVGSTGVRAAPLGNIEHPATTVASAATTTQL